MDVLGKGERGCEAGEKGVFVIVVVFLCGGEGDGCRWG